MRHLVNARYAAKIRPRDIATCNVVDQFCEAAANMDPPEGAKFECFSCGQPVCGKCSSYRKYYHYTKKKRLCNNCQVDYDGNQKMVMDRLHRLAEAS